MKKQKPTFLFFIVIIFFAVNLPIFLLGQNETLHTTEFVVQSDKISSPVTIVQLSDLHEKSFGENNSRLFEEVQKLSPDIIVITGDMIFNSYTKDPNLTYMENFAEQCVNIAPSFFITGNHDRYNEKAVKNAFSKNGVAVLDESVVPIFIGDTALNIGGIDDPDVDPGSISRFSFSNQKHFNILLAHKPEKFQETYGDTGANLILSGHTHGGQIRLPWGKAIFTPDGFFPEYSDGLYTSNDTTMIISRGLGSSGIPLRLFSLPEIACIRLLPSNSSEAPQVD